MVSIQVCIQRMRNGGLGMLDLESHWLAERLAYLGRSLTRVAVWRRKASRIFPCLQSDPKAEGQRKPMGETPFVRECRARMVLEWGFGRHERRDCMTILTFLIVIWFCFF